MTKLTDMPFCGEKCIDTPSFRPFRGSNLLSGITDEKTWVLDRMAAPLDDKNFTSLSGPEMEGTGKIGAEDDDEASVKTAQMPMPPMPGGPEGGPPGAEEGAEGEPPPPPEPENEDVQNLSEMLPELNESISKAMELAKQISEKIESGEAVLDGEDVVSDDNGEAGSTPAGTPTAGDPTTSKMMASRVAADDLDLHRRLREDGGIERTITEPVEAVSSIPVDIPKALVDLTPAQVTEKITSLSANIEEMERKGDTNNKLYHSSITVKTHLESLQAWRKKHREVNVPKVAPKTVRKQPSEMSDDEVYTLYHKMTGVLAKLESFKGFVEDKTWQDAKEFMFKLEHELDVRFIDTRKKLPSEIAGKAKAAPSSAPSVTAPEEVIDEDRMKGFPKEKIQKIDPVLDARSGRGTRQERMQKVIQKKLDETKREEERAEKVKPGGDVEKFLSSAKDSVAGYLALLDEVNSSIAKIDRLVSRHETDPELYAAPDISITDANKKNINIRKEILSALKDLKPELKQYLMNDEGIQSRIESLGPTMKKLLQGYWHSAVGTVADAEATNIIEEQGRGTAMEQSNLQFHKERDTADKLKAEQEAPKKEYLQSMWDQLSARFGEKSGKPPPRNWQKIIEDPDLDLVGIISKADRQDLMNKYGLPEAYAAATADVHIADELYNMPRRYTYDNFKSAKDGKMSDSDMYAALDASVQDQLAQDARRKDKKNIMRKIDTDAGVKAAFDSFKADTGFEGEEALRQYMNHLDAHYSTSFTPVSGYAGDPSSNAPPLSSVESTPRRPGGKIPKEITYGDCISADLLDIIDEYMAEHGPRASRQVSTGKKVRQDILIPAYQMERYRDQDGTIKFKPKIGLNGQPVPEWASGEDSDRTDKGTGQMSTKRIKKEKLDEDGNPVPGELDEEGNPTENQTENAHEWVEEKRTVLDGMPWGSIFKLHEFYKFLGQLVNAVDSDTKTIGRLMARMDQQPLNDKLTSKGKGPNSPETAAENKLLSKPDSATDRRAPGGSVPAFGTGLKGLSGPVSRGPGAGTPQSLLNRFKIKSEAKEAVDEEAKKYYKDYYPEEYGEAMVKDVEDRVGSIIEFVDSAYGKSFPSDALQRIAACVSDISYGLEIANPAVTPSIAIILSAAADGGVVGATLDKLIVTHMIDNKLASIGPSTIMRAISADKDIENKLVRVADNAHFKVPSINKSHKDRVTGITTLKDLAIDAAGVVAPHVPMKVTDQNIRGSYLYLTIGWDPDITEDWTDQSVKQALRSFVKGLDSSKEFVDYGMIGRLVVEAIDMSSGEATVYARAKKPGNAVNVVETE